MLPEGYTDRLLKLVQDMASELGVSYSELARRTGEPQFKARISFWKKNGLSQAITEDSLELLSKVDPKGRTAEEINNYLLGKDDDMRCVRPKVFGLLTNGEPIHQMVANALSLHGYSLNDEGIEFFVQNSNASREDRKNVLRQYLARKKVAPTAMNATYPVIAHTLNLLCGLEGDQSLNALELAELDGVRSIAPVGESQLIHAGQ